MMIKKISSALVAVLMVATITMAAFAVGTVSDIKDGVFVSELKYSSGSNYDAGRVVSSSEGNFAPGETFNIYLDPSKFGGSDIEFTPESGMPAQDLMDAGVSVKISGGKNPNLIDSVSFVDSEVNGKKVAFIRVKMTDSNSSDEKNFDTTIALLANGGAKREFAVSGSIGGSTVTVSPSSEYVYLGNGETAQADSDISTIKVDLGNDVVLYAKMNKGNNYSGVSNTTATDKDKQLLEKLSNGKVVNIDSKGFDTATEVEIKTDSIMYVYDASGKKIGTTDQKLQFLDKYYLSDKDVDVNVDALPDSTDTDKGPALEPEDNLPTPQPGDENPIPNTGISTVTKVAGGAFVVGILAITMLAVTGSKRKK